jgi:hypothetical protein
MRIVSAATVAAAMALLAASAPNAAFRLELDAGLFRGDDCLAPAFDGPNCSAQLITRDDSRPTASAALLAPDLPDPAPRLTLDDEVFRAGTDVTYSD